MSTDVCGSRSLRIFVASSPSIPGMRTSMITTLGRRLSATAIALAPSDASPTTRICGARESERRRPSLTTSWSSAIRQVISSGIRLPQQDDNRVGSARTLEGLIVDPIVGPFPGALVVVEGRIAAVERDDDLAGTPVVFPGFIDLHVYDPAGIEETGVTCYLLATRDPNTPAEGLCLGLHLEGPFLNSEAAGAIPVDELQPVDLPLLGEWLAGGHVRLVTVSPEIPGGLDAIALVAEEAVAAVGHTRANVATVRAALD